MVVVDAASFEVGFSTSTSSFGSVSVVSASAVAAATAAAKKLVLEKSWAALFASPWLDSVESAMSVLSLAESRERSVSLDSGEDP